MREITTQIEIAAPIERVWQILINIEAWHEWNPIVNEASGKAALGATLEVTMRGPDGKDSARYSPVISEFTAPGVFSWRAKMMAEVLFTNDKIVRLEETTAGTHVTHTEAFSGWMLPMFWSRMESGVAPMLDNMNSALKEKAEKSD